MGTWHGHFIGYSLCLYKLQIHLQTDGRRMKLLQGETSDNIKGFWSLL